MQEEPQDNQEPEENGAAEPEPENLEFKPVVKYIGIGLGLLLLFGAEYAAYSVGYSRGGQAGSPEASATMQAELNAKAVENLTHFMQLSSASDAVLQDTVANYEQKLSWIKDEHIRQEAEWSIAQNLIDRGMVGHGKKMLAELFRNVPRSQVWGRRAACVAGALSAEGKTEEALAYYQIASSHYAALHKDKEQLQVISEQVELLAASGSPSADIMVPLEALQQEASALGEMGRGVQANILAYMGTLYRQAGDSEKAMQCFEKALQGVDSEHTPELASAAVCYGMALLEKGKTKQAEKFLRDGVSRLGDDPANASYVVAALRELARLERDRGNADEALGLLYRAEGSARGRIPKENPFWSMLYDQRGWVNLVDKSRYDLALEDFQKALKHEKKPGLLVQPLEGAGRCCLELGQCEKAIEYLKKAVDLRIKHQPKAVSHIGRLYFLLGSAYDMASDVSHAVESYSSALKYLPADSPDRANALMSMGYALNQASRWQEALQVWQELAPLVKDDEVMRDEVRKQVEAVQRRVAPQAAPAENTQPPRSTPQPVRSSRRSGRR